MQEEKRQESRSCRSSGVAEWTIRSQVADGSSKAEGQRMTYHPQTGKPPSHSATSVTPVQRLRPRIIAAVRRIAP